jgi:hypothetical protein
MMQIAWVLQLERLLAGGREKHFCVRYRMLRVRSNTESDLSVGYGSALDKVWIFLDIFHH